LEDFSKVFLPGKFRGGQGEADQRFGDGRERQGLCSDPGSEVKHAGAKFYRGGIMTTDPVCGMKVDDKRSEFHTQFAGKKYFFCSENCRKEFEAAPDEYMETAAA
jgi:YHS domain-containing protein